jgi:serine/threonine protein phosphatase PrpC
LIPNSFIIDDTFLQDGCFAGVFDGHGGASVSNYVKKTLFSSFLQRMPEKRPWTDSSVSLGLEGALNKVDSEVTKVHRWDHEGSTLAAVFINPHGSQLAESKLLQQNSESSMSPFSIITMNVSE